MPVFILQLETAILKIQPSLEQEATVISRKLFLAMKYKYYCYDSRTMSMKSLQVTKKEKLNVLTVVMKL